MIRPLYIVYIPGLGEESDPLRRMCLKVWRVYGVHATMVPANWRSEELYVDKRARIEAALEELRGKRVLLVGESAGGSMALSVFGQYADELVGVVTLCGKNTRADTIGPSVYSRYPAFRESIEMAEQAAQTMTREQRARFLSIVPLFDSRVPVSHTLLPGCQKMTVPSVGHLFSIVMMLSLFSLCIAWRLRRMSGGSEGR